MESTGVKWIKTKEACERYAMSRYTLATLARQIGALVAVGKRQNRFDQEMLDAWFAEQARKVTE